MNSSQTRRLFFALWPDDAVRARIAERADALFKQHGLSGHPSRQKRYHMTLNFLGEEVPALVGDSARKVAARIEAPPFTLQLDTAGSFNNKQVPIWLGSGTPPQELKYLDQALRQALKGLRVARTPGFKPHVTVLRDANRRLREEAIEPIEWHVDEFVLIDSYLNEKPVRYEILERFPLRGESLKPEPEQAVLF